MRWGGRSGRPQPAGAARGGREMLPAPAPAAARGGRKPAWLSPRAARTGRARHRPGPVRAAQGESGASAAGLAQAMRGGREQTSTEAVSRGHPEPTQATGRPEPPWTTASCGYPEVCLASWRHGQAGVPRLTARRGCLGLRLKATPICEKCLQIEHLSVNSVIAGFRY